jgi:hypothetical protein
MAEALNVARQALIDALAAWHEPTKDVVTNKVNAAGVIVAAEKLLSVLPGERSLQHVEVSARGFKRLDPIKGHFANGEVERDSITIAESSCAWPPSIHIWVDEEEGSGIKAAQAHIQLSLDAAERLRDQLTWLIENHYQVEGE